MLRALTLCLTLWLGSGQSASSAPPDGGDSRPAWLQSIRLELSAAHDDNVYFQQLGELANRSSLVTSIRPGLTLALLPPREDAPQRHLRLSYSPEIVRYPSWSEQDHENHAIGLSFGDATLSATWKLENEIVLTAGRGTAQEWPSPLGLPRSPVIGGPEFRSRTANHEIRGRIDVTLRSGERWFLRPRAQWWATDFRTEQRPIEIPNPDDTFYGNYVDRADLHGGFDLGIVAAPKTFLTVGYRIGVQSQGELAGSPYRYDNHYHVVLLGIEGSPSERLTYGLQIGPDFRSYGTSVRPDEDRNPIVPHALGRIAWSVDERTDLTGLVRLFRFMPGGGAGAMAMTLARATVTHRLSSSFSVSGGLRVFGGSLDPPDPRGTDWLFSGLAGLTWSGPERLEVSLSYRRDAGRSEEADVYDTPAGPIPGPNGSGREYDRNVVSLSAAFDL
jgi:hypothetical protein